MTNEERLDLTRTDTGLLSGMLCHLKREELNRISHNYLILVRDLEDTLVELAEQLEERKVYHMEAIDLYRGTNDVLFKTRYLAEWTCCFVIWIHERKIFNLLCTQQLPCIYQAYVTDLDQVVGHPFSIPTPSDYLLPNGRKLRTSFVSAKKASLRNQGDYTQRAISSRLHLRTLEFREPDLPLSRRFGLTLAQARLIRTLVNDSSDSEAVLSDDPEPVPKRTRLNGSTDE